MSHHPAAPLRKSTSHSRRGRHHRYTKVQPIRQARTPQQQYRLRRHRQTVMFVIGMLAFLVLFGVGYLGYQAFTFIPQQIAKLHLAPSDWQPRFEAPVFAASNAPKTVEPETPLEFFQDKIAVSNVQERNLPLMLASPTRSLLPLRYDFDHSTALTQKLLPLMPESEDTVLTQQLNDLFAQYGDRYQPHIYVYDPNDNSYSQINAYDDVQAASVIKLPVLMAFFQRVDQGMVQKSSPILYQEFLKASGAGELQYRDSGDMIPAVDVAKEMIQASDNTCTNMIMWQLGGYDRVNEQLHQIGINSTFIRNWLPDLEGTNKISMYEMATLLYNLDRGYLLTPTSRYDALNILRGTHNRRLLVDPLPKDALVAHKTGDIATALGDAGIVFMPQPLTYNTASELSSNTDPITRYGDYIVAIQVDRPYNDYTARDMIQKASKLIYDHIQTKHAASQFASSSQSL